MSTSLDDLRIDRRPGPQSSRAPWLVVFLILAAIAGCALWFKSGPSAIEVKTEPARAAVSGAQKPLLNASNL